MNYLRNLSWGRKLALAICVILACLSLGAGIFLPKLADASAGAKPVQTVSTETDKKSTAAATVTPKAAAPRYEYESVTATLSEDAKIYVNNTGWNDLKSNLVVMGTARINGLNVSIRLAPEEYSISVTIGTETFTEADSDVILSTYDEDNFPDSFNVNVTCGNREATVTIDKTSIVDGDYPVYTKIRVKNDLTNVPADYSKSTLKNFSGLIVEGTTNGSTYVTIVNRELYEVTKLLNFAGEEVDHLTEGSSATFVVTYTYTDSDGDEHSLTADGEILNTTSATLLSLSLEVSPAYTYKNNYYYDENGNSVFFVNMSRIQIIDRLVLTAHYLNSSRVLKITENGSSFIASTGEAVLWQGNPSLGNAETVTIQLGVGSLSVTVQIPLEARTYKSLSVSEEALDANGVLVCDTLYSYSTSQLIMALSGKVIATYNTGDATDALTAGYTTDNLLPSPDILASLDEGDTYVKTVKVYYAPTEDSNGPVIDTSVESTEVKVNVTYVMPEINAITFGGTLRQQTYRRPNNYSGLDLSAYYIDGDDYVVTSLPLSSFDAEGILSTTYYDKSGEVLNINEFDSRVSKIRISFNYNGKSLNRDYTVGGSGMTGFQIRKLPLPVPILDTTVVPYEDGVSKSISFAEDFDPTALANLQDGGINIYSSEFCTTLSDTASLADGNITFTAGGNYYVKFALSSSDTDEVEWESVSNINITTDVDRTYLVYKIEIQRGPVDLRVVVPSQTTYGTEITPLIMLAPKGTGNYTDITNDNSISKTVTYYDTDGTEYDSYPRNVGTYYVKVTTAENDKYEGGSSAEPNYSAPAFGAPSFTIKPKELDFDRNALRSITYDGNEHSVSEFIVGGAASGFAYPDDTAETVFNLPTTKFTHVSAASDKQYEITLTLITSNYVWSGNAASNPDKKVKIQIAQRFLTLSLSGSGLGFVYGECETLPDASANLTKNDGEGGETYFFAEVNEVEYYLANVSGYPTGSPLSYKDGDFKAWAAGTYIVKFTTSYRTGTAYADEATYKDYTLPEASTTFEISRKKIDKVTFAQDGQSKTYDGNSDTYTFGKWNAVNSVDLGDILEVEIYGILTGKEDAPANRFSAGIINDNDGTFKVLHAGEYVICVSFKDTDGEKNYDWIFDGTEDEDADEHDPLTFTYTVNQVTLYTKWNDPDFIYNPSGQQQIPELVPDDTQLGFAEDDGLTISTAVYSGSSASGTALTVTSSVVDGETLYYITGDAGTYYITLVTFSAKTEDGFDYTNNYIDDSTAEKAYAKEFSITARDLYAPQRTDVEFEKEYAKTAYTVNNATYFSNWDDYLYGSGSCMLVFKVVVDESSKPTYSGYTFTPVTADGGMTDVATYTIYVYPASNFQWHTGAAAIDLDADGIPAGTKGFSYTFEITKKEIEISWTNTELTYNGREQKPTATASGTLYDSASTIEISVSGGKTNAGSSYMAVADTLTGTRGFNYSLPDENSQGFSIAKRAIYKPTAKSYSSTFNESEQAIIFDTPTGFTESEVLGFNWSTVVSCTIEGKYNFEGITKAHSSSARFTFGTDGTGTMWYTYAGEYTIKFKINSAHSNNYYWNNQDTSITEYTVPTAIKISRKEVTAPELGADQALEYTGSVVKPSIAGTDLYSVAYGTYDDYATVTDDPNSITTLSQYFVRLRIKSDRFDPLNYVWKESGEAKNAYLTQAGVDQYAIKYEDGGDYGVSIYLTYVITGQQFKVKYDIQNYNFGDNGTSQEATLAKNFVLGSSQDYETVYAALENGQATAIFTFYALDSVTTDFTGKTPLGEDELENGIPWNAGIYGVYILITFTSTNFADIPLSYTFKVEPKVITDIDWIGDTTATYDGETHTYTAKLRDVDIPERKAGEEKVSITLSVGWRNNDSNLPKNVGTHSFIIKSTSDNGTSALASNYSLDTGIGKSLSISRRTVKVEFNGDDKTAVYGVSSFTFGKYWVYPDGAAETAKFVETTDYITYELWLDSDKVYPASGNVLSAGTYTLKPVLDTTKTGYNNYLLECDAFGTFEIEARTVTITLSSDPADLKATYGDSVSLGNVYGAEWTNGTGSWLASVDSVSDVFTLSSDAEAQWADVGAYDIVLTLVTNGNYTVTVTGATKDGSDYTWADAFTIENADITATAEGVEKPYTANPYDYINGLVTVTADILNSSVNTAHWYITAKGDEQTAPSATAEVWEEVTAKTATDAMNGNYWIKVEADNHNPAVLENYVTITITKAELTLSVNLTISYGENNPADYDGEGNIYQIDGLRTPTSDGYKSIYTVEGFKSEADKALFFSEDAEGLFGLSGTFTYSAEDYIAGTSKQGTYAITLSGVTLESKNYTFKAEEGVLTVIPLQVDITYKTVEDGINVIRAAYYAENLSGAFPYAQYFEVSTSVTSSYGSDLVAIYDADNLSNIFGITTSALVYTDGSITGTNNVGEYTITVGGADADKYSFAKSVSDYEGTFIIEGATFTSATTIESIEESLYTESAQSLTGAITVTDVKNSQPVTVTYVTSETAMSDDDVLDATGAAVADYSDISEPSYTNVSKHYVYFVVRVENHVPHIISRVIEIIKADNSFTTDFAFANAFSSTDYDAELTSAWTYGLYTETTQNGYNNDGDQKITAPVSAFSAGNGGSVNQIKYYLLEGKVNSVTDLDNPYTDIEALFEDWHQANSFKVGEYTLYYVIDGTDNYNTAEAYVYFSVAKRALTVTANSPEIQYGNTTAYNYVISGYAYIYKDGAIISEDEETAYGENATAVFTSSYEAGNSVGSYDIEYSAGEEELDNYTVTYVDGQLTVIPRDVTIVVHQKQSPYAYYDEAIKAHKALTYYVASGSFFEGDVDGDQTKTNALTLDTTAYIANGENETTQEIGKYPIYAVFANSTYKDNYNVTVTSDANNKLYEGELDIDNELLVTSGAGVYTIVTAVLKITVSDLHYYDEETQTYIKYTNNNPFVYDGRQKAYFATVDDVNITETFTAEYRVRGTEAYSSELPVNVGTYEYRFVSSNKNYSYDTSSFTPSFTIQSSQLSIKTTVDGADKVTSDSQVYKNGEFELRFTFGNFVEGEQVNITSSVTANKLSGTPSTFAGASFDPFGALALTRDTDTPNSFTVKVKNAGVYTVTISLNGMDNYNMSAYTFTFTVNRNSSIVVNAESVNVQYGTNILNASNRPVTVTDGRFGGFNLKYSDDIVKNEPDGYFLTNNVTYTTSGEHGAYNPNGTQAGWRYNITPGNIVAYNYEFTQSYSYGSTGILTVIKREITVKLKGLADSNNSARVTYDGTSKYNLVQSNILTNSTAGNFLTPDSNWYGSATSDNGQIVTKLGISLTLQLDTASGKNGTNVGVYDMIISANSTNYEVTFENYSAKTPQFEIMRKALTVTAVVPNSGTIVYGNSDEGYFSIVYSGLVDKDRDENGNCIISDDPEFSLSDLGFTAQISTTDYEAWVSHADEIYTVTPYGLEFSNYNVTFATATMKVVAREITVLPSNTVYEELDGNYNNGISGKTRIAGVTFTDLTDFDYVTDYDRTASNGIVTNGSISKGEILSNTTFKFEYYVNNKWQNAAPDRAGEYQVRITLTGSDFKFDTTNTKGSDDNALVNVSAQNATFGYTVARKTLTLAWNTGSADDFFVWKDEDSGQKTITIPDFVADVIWVTKAQRLYGVNNSQYDDIPLNTANSDGGYYTATNDGFELHIYGVGTYSVTLELNDNAKLNYVIGNGTEAITRSFTMSTTGFSITALTIRDWVYREYNGDIDTADHNLPVISLSNGLTESIGFAYTYVLYTGTNLPSGTFYTLPDDAKNLSFTALLPSDAGTYILQAEYTGTQYATTSAYCIFHITPKQVTAPVFANKSAVDGKEYTAEAMTANVEFVTDYFKYTFTKNVNDGIVLPAEDFEGLTVTATNAGKYTLSFTLSNTRNYAWSDASLKNTDSVKIEWTIAKSNKNTVKWSSNALNAEYGDGFALDATPHFGGEVTYQYAVRENDSTNGVTWSEITSVNADIGAGNYWLRAISAGTDNYNLATADIKLTIEKAELKATAYGSMTYGGQFGKDGEYGYTISGWKLGEEDVTVTGVIYALTGENEKLNAREYGISLTLDGTEVKGLSALNYYIVAEEGTFTVNRRSVGISIGDGSSVYGEATDISDVKLNIITGNIVEGDSEDDLNISLYVEGDLTDGYLNRGSYRINATGYTESENYQVSVFPGIYTVEALRIYVELEAGGGEYGNVTGASVIKALTYEGDEDVSAKFGNLAPVFGFLYSGTANDGTQIASTPTIPSLAGNYTATARIVERVNNFTLVSEKAQSVTFIVARKTINEGEIAVGEIRYNKDAHTPEIIDSKYAGYYTAEEVSYTDVGDYAVKLTLTDSNNYKWTSVEGNDYNLPFSILRGENKFLDKIEIAGWNFGDSANTPEGETLFGSTSDYVYMYSTSENGEYTRTVPSSAGEYWVKIVVPQSANYEAQESEPVSFVIGKRTMAVPTLEVITDGDNANATYTGSRLQAKVLNYDPVIMRIIYDGDISSAGNVAVYAVNAGTYSVYFALNDEANYMWADGASLTDNNAVTTWTVARKKLAKPTMNTSLYMVNGGTLTFTPEGFDESLMEIAGNTTSYGGVFKVIVSIKDTVNYEWADASVEDITFDWLVVGWDTVFIIVVSVLGVVAGIAAITIGVQYLVHKRKKKDEALKEAAASAAIAESVAAATANQPVENPAQPNEEAQFEEELKQPAEETPAEEAEEKPAEETPAEEAEEKPAEETPAEEAEEKPAEEKAEGENTDEE